MTMKITAIKTQVKNAGRYSLYVDGEYAFSLSADALLDAKLVNGQEISDEEVKLYKKLSADDKAYGLVLAYVARRMRSEGELRDYFRRKQYDDALGDQLVARLRHAGLVDDRDFAQRWVENRRLLKPVSSRRLKLELKQKHISDQIISEVLNVDAADADDKQALRELIAKKRTQSRYQERDKLMAYLLRQGFSYDDVKAGLGNVLED